MSPKNQEARNISSVRMMYVCVCARVGGSSRWACPAVNKRGCHGGDLCRQPDLRAEVRRGEGGIQVEDKHVPMNAIARFDKFAAYLLILVTRKSKDDIIKGGVCMKAMFHVLRSFA